MKAKRTKRKPRNFDMPPGTEVWLELDEVRSADGTRIVRTKQRTRTRSAPWELAGGQWVVLVEGKTGGWMLERVRPIKTLHPRPPTQHTIPICQVEIVARAVFGETFVKLVQRDRVGRSETITIHVTPCHTLKFAHRSVKPDAVRKYLLDFLPKVATKVRADMDTLNANRLEITPGPEEAPELCEECLRPFFGDGCCSCGLRNPG